MKKPIKKNMGGMVNRPNMPAQANAAAARGGIGSQVKAMAQAPGRTGGIGQQVSAMRPGFKKGDMVGKPAMAGTGKPAMAGMGKPAGAGAGPSWKPAKTGEGNYGKVVSAAAHARNAARKAAAPAAPMAGRGEAMKAKMGEMKAKIQAWRQSRPQRPEGEAGRKWGRSAAMMNWRGSRPKV